MEKIYPSFQEYLQATYTGPYMATDIIIRYHDVGGSGKEGIVLIERKFAPYGLALPGGKAEHISLSQNAIKEGKEETGLDVVLDNPSHPLCVLSDPNQDPRAFIATAVYTGQGYGTLKPREDEDAKWAGVFTLDELSDLLLDEKRWAFPIHHRRAVELYLNSIGYQRGK
ncbi:MAG: NUDIX domain-containing protein [Candidatus Woesearchaeota archaeon]